MPLPSLADTLIVNALLLDGTGSPSQQGSVRIVGDQIIDVGALTPRATDTVVDAGGLVLSPGFIDTHSHADEHLLTQRDAAPKITQGITTVVVGQDGSSPYPLNDFFQALERAPAAINVAAYVGHNTLRELVMGKGSREEASPVEMQSMAGLLRSELNSGAVGLSTGLEYEPGIYSSKTEVLLLAQQTAQRGGRYISHMRSEDRWFEDSIEEIIEIGRVTG
ncbi:amidohydrolase family protein, partial [Luminiphilus sp.]|nr:amidohydrolase family protein [Luminiphilus sp.]